MYNFWVVMKLEFRLIWRNWVTWLMVLVMLFIGALCASSNRNEPWSGWAHLGTTSFFLSLILTFCTGNQIRRDHAQRLDRIVLSTPVATQSYVCGKYLAGLASLLLLAGSGLFSALLIDHFATNSSAILLFAPAYYPPLGAPVYLIGWAWLTLTPVAFGATFMFACMTLTRGQRAIASLAVLLIWVLPMFLTQSMPQLLDITATVFSCLFSRTSGPCSSNSFQAVPDSTSHRAPGWSAASQSHSASHAPFSGRDTAFVHSHSVSLEPSVLPGPLPAVARSDHLWDACAAPSCLKGKECDDANTRDRYDQQTL
ncbi:ABC transporter permease [Dictyobacter arantiisoli]|uniref:ABC transporter permease n=1 Tax=Dictyobacter arantiisoli TaxID=2014874 RepID=UPI0011EF26D0|nr:hypothetical protein [Dictyobacter arantiisoli]